MFHTWHAGADCVNPASYTAIRANGASAAKTDRAALFARKDANGDGQLTREEFLANQPDPDKAPARFTAFDTDKSGVLTKEEFISMGGRGAAKGR